MIMQSCPMYSWTKKMLLEPIEHGYTDLIVCICQHMVNQHRGVPPICKGTSPTLPDLGLWGQPYPHSVPQPHPGPGTRGPPTPYPSPGPWTRGPPDLGLGNLAPGTKGLRDPTPVPHPHPIPGPGTRRPPPQTLD